jgi:hypothetical protein
MRYSEQCQLGHEVLDAEHQLLFGLITELESEIQAGRGQAVLVDVLQRLFIYAILHFATEDRLLSRRIWVHVWRARTGLTKPRGAQASRLDREWSLHSIGLQERDRPLFGPSRSDRK